MKVWYFCFIFCLISIFFSISQKADAFFPPREAGYDISYPQCDSLYPRAPYELGIVGVSDGKAFTKNPCLLTEFFWAKKHKATASVYINLNYPSGNTIHYGISGLHRACEKKNEICHAYNYGYEAATYAYEYAQSQFVTASVWWIDVELANTWADPTNLNDQVLQGALDFLSSHHLQAGIYSTKRDWTAIMGKNFQPFQDLLYPVPNWIGGGTDNNKSVYCIMPFIATSPVWLVQYVDGNFDSDYTC